MRDCRVGSSTMADGARVCVVPGRRAVSALLAGAAALLLLALSPAVASAHPTQTFDAGNAGWRVLGNDATDEQAETPATFEPGGYISATDEVDETMCDGGGCGLLTFVSSDAPGSPWHADLSHHYGGQLSFDLLTQRPGPPGDGNLAVAITTEDQASLGVFLGNPTGSDGAWTTYSIALSPSNGELQYCDLSSGCAPATAKNIVDVLKNSNFVYVGADAMGSGMGETVALDNVALSGGATPDKDSDGIYDFNDNCSNVANPGQQNRDGDAFGDVCDPDDDGDGVSDTADKCKTIKAGTTSGCPAVTRTLTLKYAAATHKFSGNLGASKAQCKSAQAVTVFKQRPGADLNLGTATTTATGAYSLTKQVGSGEYYSTVPQKVVVNVAQCNAATSPVLTR